ncbi:994_t:CDS:2 [Funneliformis caledonium]|uniref:994_t:CDS:1 n=1 Tax=Funneliformis caledonium TaxID=1117310 RepID=A0A9N9ETD8_9GLOM|nr:994_t:CDS:2 [Funneliformis caledonium]
MQIHGLCFLLEQKVNPILYKMLSLRPTLLIWVAEGLLIRLLKIEAFYKIPIHEDIIVCGFEAEIDGRSKLKGFVREENEDVDQ